jgi:isoquinoline 1-oxidoreductase subunit beta
MSRVLTMERREFLQSVVAGGLVLAVGSAGCRRVDDDLRGGGETGGGITPVAWVRLDPAGTVTVVCHRSEMGQGIRTSMAMIIADELEADWSRVRVEQAPGDEKRYGSQNTDGSSSIRNFLSNYREAGATVRSLLETAAARQWNVPEGEVEAQFHEVIHRPSGRRIGYGALVATARDLPLPAGDRIRLKDPAQFRYVGKEIPIVDLRDMTTGKAIYGQDLRREGMRVAVIARPPVYGARIAALDSAEAEQVPGVERVIRLPETEPPSGFNAVGGVAVVARNTWAALQGRNRLKVTWTDGPNSSYDSTAYRRELEATAQRSGKAVRRQGDAPAAIARAPRRVTADYYIPHLAHAQMEPPAALAVFENGQMEIWAPTQHPQAARDTVAGVLKLPVDRVTVHVTLLGGAFGRKSKPDFIVEAAWLARELRGAVKVVWTREDDIQHDYFHTVAVEHLEAGLDGQGKVTGWLHRSVLPSIGATFNGETLYQSAGEAGQGVTDLPFALDHYLAEVGPAPAHVRIGWYRSVINIPHAFAIGSFVDELAHAAGRDPRDFLLELLGPDRLVDMSKVGLVGDPWNYGAGFEKHPIDIARYRNVLQLVSSTSGWGERLPQGEGRGIAVHRSFLSYVAAVARVKVGADGVVAVPRVDIAIDAGFVVHPERVRAQLEGATIMALGNTLYGEITFQGGRVVQSNYTDYRVPRIGEAPREIAVQVVPSTAPPGGVGEPGVPPIGAAICNAIFAATGKRLRSLPVGEQLKAGASTA